MRIVISDSSCLIDLRKAGLLAALLKLPYEFLIPDTLFEDELLQFSKSQKRTLLEGGLKVMELPAAGVLRAGKITGALPGLSIHDGFAFALAERNPGCILLTGDGDLRRLAKRHAIEFHGVLWVIDEIHRNGLAGVRVLHAALVLFRDDTTVRLPPIAVKAALRRYAALL